MGLVKIKNVQNGKIGFWKISHDDALKFAETIFTSYHPNWKNYRNNKRRHQILATRLLAHELCSKNDIKQNEFGKPYLISGTDFISISNDNNYIALLLSNHPCGIDLQSVNTKILKIASKFQNKNDFIQNNKIQELTQLWAAKEAMYKVYGTPTILFKQHLTIEQKSSNEFIGFCAHPHIKFQCKINMYSFKNYLLAFTSEIIDH